MKHPVRQRRWRERIRDNRPLKRLRVVLGLGAGTDVDGTIERIRSGIRLRGANLWILVCAALIASIGLNTSSVAVIIGAMLISPLMGPILGIGLGVAIHDRSMLFRSVRTMGISVAISLATSALYFLVTPITSPNAELLARTQPTILDVGIAFFGGIAGIVAGSRRESTTAIPGVAIATALMPPICTVGYGLATARWNVALGALYLFFINAVFISVATYLIARFLRFPQADYVTHQVKRRVDRLITAFVVVAMLPSIIIFYDVISRLRNEAAAEHFVRRDIEVDGRTALSWKLDRRDSIADLRVYLAGTPFDSAEVDSLSRLLPQRGLSNTELELVQLNIPQQTRDVSADDLLEMLQSEDLQRRLVENIVTMIGKPAPPKAVPTDTIAIAQLAREIRSAFPTIVDVSYAPTMASAAVSAPADTAADTVARAVVDTIPTLLVRHDSTATIRERRAAMKRLETFLQARLEKDSVRVIDLTTDMEHKR
jgi:uncharacterized hydrophobic protein (TIGR00271 family)